MKASLLQYREKFEVRPASPAKLKRFNFDIIGAMHRKTVFISLILAFAIFLSLALYFYLRANSSKSDEEIRKMFACNRVTTDVIKTDIYCKNPDLYRQDLKEHKVIKSDF